MKLGMVDFVQDHTPHDNFGGSSTTWANTRLVKSRSFFTVCCFLHHVPTLHLIILTIYTPKRVFMAKDMPFGDQNNIYV